MCQKAFKEKLNTIVSTIENKQNFESAAPASDSEEPEDTGFNPFGVNG